MTIQKLQKYGLHVNMSRYVESCASHTCIAAYIIIIFRLLLKKSKLVSCRIKNKPKAEVIAQ